MDIRRKLKTVAHLGINELDTILIKSLFYPTYIEYTSALMMCMNLLEKQLIGTATLFLKFLFSVVSKN